MQVLQAFFLQDLQDFALNLAYILQDVARSGSIWKAISFSRKAGILSGPEALNGLIFKSKSATPAILIVIGYMARILRLFNDGKYAVSSVV